MTGCAKIFPTTTAGNSDGKAGMTKDKTAERPVTQAQLNRLADWSLRKPVIAVMGEFSSGKSTLMNLLLGRAILPTQVTATRMPPVWLRHGDRPPYRVDHDGNRHPVDLSNPEAIPLDDTRYIGLYAEADLLRRCDLIDTPGISDPNIKVQTWLRTIGYANAVMWCTHAGQAWRESERGMWENLPRRLRETSILLVTKKDKIRTADDQKRIDRRLEREASGLFNARMFVSLTNAIKAREQRNADAWAASGGQQFADMLEQVVEGIYIQRSFTLARYVVSDADASPRPTSADDAASRVDQGGILGFVPGDSGPVRPDVLVLTQFAIPLAEEDAALPADAAPDAPPKEDPVSQDPAVPQDQPSGDFPTLSGYRLRPPPVAPDTERKDLSEYRLADPATRDLGSDAVLAPEGPDPAARELDLIRDIRDHVARHFDLTQVPRLQAAFQALLDGTATGRE